MSITVKYGAGNSIETTPELGATWAAVIASSKVEVGLGLPADASRLGIHINGVEVDAAALVQDGDVASLTTRANEKG